MFGLGTWHTYQLYGRACDMRKSFNGLSGLVSNELGRNPLSGEVFIFINRNRTLIKLLHWEPGGFVLDAFFAMCKKHDVNPFDWLKYTLENIMSINQKAYASSILRTLNYYPTWSSSDAYPLTLHHYTPSFLFISLLSRLNSLLLIFLWICFW